MGKIESGTFFVQLNLLPDELREEESLDVGALLPKVQHKRGVLFVLGLLVWLPLAMWGLWALVMDVVRQVSR
jgi:hypothetical protein